MRLKSFYANTMTEAMQMVRDTLGDDAVIVATREENNGRSVRVTAAVERMDERQSFGPRTGGRSDIAAQMARGGHEYLQYDAEEDAEDAIIDQLTDLMLAHGVPGDITDTILSTAAMMGMPDAQSSLKASIDHTFNFHPLPMKSPRKALMMVGAPGAGKTLATAKLAARAAMAKLHPAVITCDTVRAGGVEQLEAFTKLLQIPLYKARKPEELQKHLAAVRGTDLVLIDTSGCNPFDIDDMQRISRFMEAGTIEPVLVMAAGGDAEESAEMARCFGVLGVQRIFPTRLDVARRMGGLLAAAGRGSLSFCDASNTPMVAGGVITLTPQSMVSLLMPQNKKNSDKNTKPLRQTG